MSLLLDSMPRSNSVKGAKLTRTGGVVPVEPLKPIRVKRLKKKTSTIETVQENGLVVTPRSRQLVLSLTGLANVSSEKTEEKSSLAMVTTPRSAEVALMLAGGISARHTKSDTTKKLKAKKPTKSDTTKKLKVKKPKVSHAAKKSKVATKYAAKFARRKAPKKQSVQRTGPRAWSAVEDSKLLAAVVKIGAKNWKVIAAHVPGRNDCQCLQRYKRVLKPGLVRGAWSSEEDRKLKEILFGKLKEMGVTESVMMRPTPSRGKWVKNWQEIADRLEGRTSKQCRERWCNHLDPSIKRGNWTPKEDKLITRKAYELGSQWSTISRLLPGRTENAVKIRYKSIQRSLAKEQRKKERTGDHSKR